jgi:hypothetical protein
MARVAAYTRASFDRGSWVNPYVLAPGYDSGNMLLTVSPGEGVSWGG